MLIYKWDCEIVSAQETDCCEEGEVLDHMHGESFAEVFSFFVSDPEPGTQHKIVLVRDDDNGRSWAYMDDGKLPDRFSDAGGVERAKVPARFHAEVRRNKA